MIRSGEAPAIGWSRNMLYSGFETLHRSVIRRQTPFAARISRTLSASLEKELHLRFSLRFLILFFAVVPIAIWQLVPSPSPVEILGSMEADVNVDDTGLDELRALLNAKANGTQMPVASTSESVYTVRFSLAHPPDSRAINLLSSFPNLREVHCPCPVGLSSLDSLKDCRKLEVVSFGYSDVSGDVIEYLLALPNVKSCCLPNGEKWIGGEAPQRVPSSGIIAL